MVVKLYSERKQVFTHPPGYDKLSMRDPLHTLLQTVADNVRKLLAESERTQRMAAGSGLSQKTISNLVNMGARQPTGGTNLKTLQRFADQSGLPAYQLLLDNLPADSERRKQLDRLVRAFVGATDAQRDWLVQTLEMMGRLDPPNKK